MGKINKGTEMLGEGVQNNRNTKVQRYRYWKGRVNKGTDIVGGEDTN